MIKVLYRAVKRENDEIKVYPESWDRNKALGNELGAKDSEMDGAGCAWVVQTDALVREGAKGSRQWMRPVECQKNREKIFVI